MMTSPLTREERQTLRKRIAREASAAQARWLKEHNAYVEVLSGPPYFRISDRKPPPPGGVSA